MLPFPLLKVNDPIWKDERVAAGDRSNACDSIPPRMLCVRLIDGVKL